MICVLYGLLEEIDDRGVEVLFHCWSICMEHFCGMTEQRSRMRMMRVMELELFKELGAQVN